jgi:hypothetical protein
MIEVELFGILGRDCGVRLVSFDSEIERAFGSLGFEVEIMGM